MQALRKTALPVLFLMVFIAGPSSLLVAQTPSIALPDAPSAVAYAPEGPVGTPDDQSSTHLTSQRDDQTHGSPGYWIKRLLRDQAGIYTSPFHESAVKWDIGLPAVTIGLVAIDKHASGELSRHPSGANADISNVGLYSTAGSLGLLLLDGVAKDNPHALETGILGVESMANSAVVYTALQLITERQRPYQDSGKGHFFQTSGLDNSFPSGHTIITWTAAATIAHEYPKPWVKWLAYGTATAVSVTRFTSLQHFPSDVVVGSTLGYLIGSHIFHTHCKPGLSDACQAK